MLVPLALAARWPQPLAAAPPAPPGECGGGAPREGRGAPQGRPRLRQARRQIHTQGKQARGAVRITNHLK